MAQEHDFGIDSTSNLYHHVSAVHASLLKMFNTTKAAYSVVFSTSFRTAYRLVANAYPFRKGSPLLLCQDNHECVRQVGPCQSPSTGAVKALWVSSENTVKGFRRLFCVFWLKLVLIAALKRCCEFGSTTCPSPSWRERSLHDEIQYEAHAEAPILPPERKSVCVSSPIEHYRNPTFFGVDFESPQVQLASAARCLHAPPYGSVRLVATSTRLCDRLI